MYLLLGRVMRDVHIGPTNVAPRDRIYSECIGSFMDTESHIA